MVKSTPSQVSKNYGIEKLLQAERALFEFRWPAFADPSKFSEFWVHFQSHYNHYLNQALARNELCFGSAFFQTLAALLQQHSISLLPFDNADNPLNPALKALPIDFCGNRSMAGHLKVIDIFQPMSNHLLNDIFDDVLSDKAELVILVHSSHLFFEIQEYCLNHRLSCVAAVGECCVPVIDNEHCLENYFDISIWQKDSARKQAIAEDDNSSISPSEPARFDYSVELQQIQYAHEEDFTTHLEGLVTDSLPHFCHRAFVDGIKQHKRFLSDTLASNHGGYVHFSKTASAITLTVRKIDWRDLRTLLVALLDAFGLEDTRVAVTELQQRRPSYSHRVGNNKSPGVPMTPPMVECSKGDRAWPWGLAPGYLLHFDVQSIRLIDLARARARKLHTGQLDRLMALALHEYPCDDTDWLWRHFQDNELQQGSGLYCDQDVRALYEVSEQELCAQRADLKAYAQELLKLMRTACSHRKAVFGAFGQYLAFPETVVRRAMLLQQCGVEPGASVLVMGDDDLVSLALAKLGYKVTVVEVDAYVRKLLQTLAHRYQLDVEVLALDLRSDCSGLRWQHYGAVFCDPMSNTDFFSLVLDRAIATTKRDGQIFVAAYPATTMQLKVLANERGLQINRQLKLFNRYSTATLELSQYRSDLFVLQKTDNSVSGKNLQDMYFPEHFFRADYFRAKHHFAWYVALAPESSVPNSARLRIFMDQLGQQLGVRLFAETLRANNASSLLCYDALLPQGVYESKGTAPTQEQKFWLSIYVDKNDKRIILHTFGLALSRLQQKIIVKNLAAAFGVGFSKVIRRATGTRVDLMLR